MHNWSTDTVQLKKDKVAYAKWQLEQLVNFGLNGQKLNKEKLKHYWSELRLDPGKRDFLKKLLWP